MSTVNTCMSSTCITLKLRLITMCCSLVFKCLIAMVLQKDGTHYVLTEEGVKQPGVWCHHELQPTDINLMLCVYSLSDNQIFWCTTFVVWTHTSLVILLHSTTAVVCCYISWKMPQSSLQHSVYTSPDRPGCNKSTGFYCSWADN